jgi:GATA-binding protein
MRPLHAPSASTTYTNFISNSNSNSNAHAGPPSTTSYTNSTSSSTVHDYRFPRRPADPAPAAAAASRAAFSPVGAPAPVKLDPAGDHGARKQLLRDSIFPTWRDDAAGDALESPDEMQRKDPLATQIWRLYRKTKTQLPNQERMENLTWRMMAMSLRKRNEEQAARYVLRRPTAYAPPRRRFLTLL